MISEFPYQLVAFLHKEPKIGESVYYGGAGWYPQIALKRRFSFSGEEAEMIKTIQEFCNVTSAFPIHVGELYKPETMPVQVLAVEPSTELMTFHTNFIEHMGANITSRYPDRDGANYLPHITAEYNDEMTIDVDSLTNKDYEIKRVCLLKDVDDENSQAYHFFDLTQKA